MEQIREKLLEVARKIPRSLYLPILLTVVGVIFFSAGLIQLLGAKQNTSTAVQDTSPQTSQKSPTTLTLTIAVDVEGAVVNPGVYKLPQDARVQDALIAAGGLSAQADREVVAKSLDLAAKLTDGAKLYIPNTADALENTTSSMNAGGTTVLGASTGLVNVNTASESDLDALPGIGPVTAQKIINARPYGNPDDLLTRKIVSNSVYQKIKDKITAQ